jgi:hypothetical protein
MNATEEWAAAYMDNGLELANVFESVTHPNGRSGLILPHATSRYWQASHGKSSKSSSSIMPNAMGGFSLTAPGRLLELFAVDTAIATARDKCRTLGQRQGRVGVA